MKIPCFKKNKENQEDQKRIVKANDREFNSQYKYNNNYISTAKYNILTFLPLNLFEQFTRLANVYFLFLVILQCIPSISSLSPESTIVPLVFVLCVTLVKDLYDDIQRHRSDNSVNNRSSWVLRNGELVEAKWKTVLVGEIIQMKNNQFVAADLLLLSASEPNSLCYIETAELDGETNLKVKQAIPELAEMGEDITKLSNFDGILNCDAPNNNLNKFNGKLEWKNNIYPVDNDKVLLRGCVLRNTDWCYGLVIYAGRDTKLMKNSGKTKFKRTHIDKLMNILIIGIFLLLIILCFACCVGAGIWEYNFGYKFQIYLPWETYVPGSILKNSSGKAAAGGTVAAVLVFFSYIIVLNTLVPISLYVSVELIRLGHSWWINWDKEMYYGKTDTPAKSRTTTLNEELGQIEYIFSDKTGTLTQNIMTFNKCSIGGISYGDYVNENGVALDITDRTPKQDFSLNPYYEKSFDFYDGRLIKSVNNNDKSTHEFFTLLSICHTVMAQENEHGELIYQAQSPDEAALVGAARNFGFVYKSRTSNKLEIEVLGKPEVYDQLCILDFNNVRKRMSLIVRKDGEITLLCKGADSVIYERLDPSSEDMKKITTKHLESFAQDGLRTLCLASKKIDGKIYDQWKQKHFEASTALDNRDELLNDVYEEIETNLTLLGATAIEDKLQDGVPETIANLSSANIKIWVLTGDKQETAINIGYSCNLLTEEMAENLHVINGNEEEEVKEQLEKAMKSIEKSLNPDFLGISNQALSNSSDSMSNALSNHYNSSILNNSYHGNPNNKKEPVFGLVITGNSLQYALKTPLRDLLFKVGSECKAVICCRVTPLQKAQVVDLVKKKKKTVTLAIGDGANDVSMIKMAHIGVGISGQEGMQAVLSSDYSIAQFRFLQRLLLVHGRWSYLRMCKFLKYFFYKNFAFTLCHFWYAFFCGFSAQTLFDPFFIAFYNVFYTSLPIMALGFFEQDVSEKLCIEYPKLYTPGHFNHFFNKKVFAWSLLEGILTSLLLFFIPYGAFQDAITQHGKDNANLHSFGLVVASCLIVTVTLRCGLETFYWTPFNHVVIWGSIIFFFIIIGIFYIPSFKYTYAGTTHYVWKSFSFWFTLLLTVVIVLLFVIAEKFYYIDTRPTLPDKLRYQNSVGGIKAKKRGARVIRRASTLRRSQRSVGRSGYAFSHHPGFGELITSGNIMGIKTPEKLEKIIKKTENKNDEKKKIRKSKISLSNIEEEKDPDNKTNITIQQIEQAKHIKNQLQYIEEEEDILKQTDRERNKQEQIKKNLNKKINSYENKSFTNSDEDLQYYRNNNNNDNNIKKKKNNNYNHNNNNNNNNKNNNNNHNTNNYNNKGQRILQNEYL